MNARNCGMLVPVPGGRVSQVETVPFNEVPRTKGIVGLEDALVDGRAEGSKDGTKVGELERAKEGEGVGDLVGPLVGF